MKAITFESTKESKELAIRHSYREWIIGRFLHYVPNVYDFLKKMDRSAQQYIRINSLKISKDELMNRLTKRGFMFVDTIIDDVLAIKKSPFPLGATPEYLLGYYYIQDLSSCISVDAMNPEEHETNLDMCAAPGGKTTYIAQKMKNTGLLVAMELNRRRMNSIVFNLNRCGVINTCVYNMDALVAKKLGLRYDKILLDAPCTCEGVIPKDVARKNSHTPKDIENCSARQMQLIDAAINLTKKGGIVIYATCSFAPEENEVVVDHALRKHDIEIVPIKYGTEGLVRFADLEFDARVRNTRRFYPHIHNTLGFYIAKIRVN
ncbi:MAG: NOL1/NOP2/sun family putative RNA methylase [Nitrososphaerales archaeon]